MIGGPLNPRKHRNLKNQRFGLLTALCEGPTKGEDPHIVWYCRCDCGNTTYVRGTFLVDGTTKSCGCLRNQPHHGEMSCPATTPDQPKATRA